MAEPAVDDPVAEVGDVSNSTAFLSLEWLLDDGKVNDEKVKFLKMRYRELHQAVLAKYNNDNFLLRRARQLRKELDAEKAKVDECGEVAKEDDTKIQSLKKQLANTEKELSIAQEKESMLQVESLELERRKLTLQSEVKDNYHEEELKIKPKFEALTNSVLQLKKEIEASYELYGKLNEEQAALVRKDAELKSAMNQQDVLIYEAKNELMKLDKEPDRAKKQADIVTKANDTARKERDILKEKRNQQNLLRAKLEKEKTEKLQTIYELKLKCEKQGAATLQKTKLADKVSTELEVEREAQKSHQAAIALETQKKKQKDLEINGLREQQGKLLREKDTTLKEHKRIEQLRIDYANERDIFRKQLDVLERESKMIDHQRSQAEVELEELRKDVDILINNFLKEEIVERQKQEENAKLVRDIKDLESDLKHRANQELRNNNKLTDLSIKREHQSRECSKAVARVHQGRDDLKVQEVVLRELLKRNSEFRSSLKSLQALYQQVKRERSNKASQIQSASQLMSETQEKIKILENELEVLRRESKSKDKSLQKADRELKDRRAERETQRDESNKKKCANEELEENITEQEASIGKLNIVITTMEEAMLKLKKQYEEAVENRNFTGIQLIDRNDELCILYEKANIQETILKNGQMEYKLRCEEIKARTIELQDLQREIDICQKLLPEVRDKEEDLATLQEDLALERTNAEQLSDALINPRNKDRWRHLSGVRSGPKPVLVSGPERMNASKFAKIKPRFMNWQADQQAASERGGGAGDEHANGDSGGTKRKTREAVAPVTVDNPDGPEMLKHRELQVEQKLSEANEKLMEKDLILEEVTEMSNRLRKEALSGREYILALAKKVNSFQSGIKDKTNKMKATLSELSMVQVVSVKMEMEVAALAEQVAKAREREDAGEEPIEGLEDEFHKTEELRVRKAAMLREAQVKQERERNMPAVLARTTAEARPNAYIADGELRIPQPFGSHAPFKDSKAAASNAARFYHKPAVQDLTFDSDED